MEDVGIFYVNLVCFMAIEQLFYGFLVYLMVIWYISPRFGKLKQEKSGNPGRRKIKNDCAFFFLLFSVLALHENNRRRRGPML
jgi:hypothetical protein